MSHRRIIVISDLHLGGPSPPMMSHPGELVRFLETLPVLANTGERVELVIAGDFIDFLAVKPGIAWTPHPVEARRKLNNVAHQLPQVFSALRAIVHQALPITILIGNHDVELALPQTQIELLKILQATPHQVLFVDDGRAYRVGTALIEHGNRYDGSNANDWTGIRAIASALSRNEVPTTTLHVTAGSQIVERIVNPLKSRYPFIDLLQPQGELVALLLLCFEPGLLLDIGHVARILRGKQLQTRVDPEPNQAAARIVPERDAELGLLFAAEYEAMDRAGTQRGAGEWIGVWIQARKDSFSAMLLRNDDIQDQRLSKVQTLMRRLLLGDRSLDLDGPTEQYGAAAARMLGSDTQTVVMGHTHLARCVGNDPNHATYINTGTWADLVVVPEEALVEGRDGRQRLSEFFRNLLADVRVRTFRPTFADLLVSEQGDVLRAALCPATSLRGS